MSRSTRRSVHRPPVLARSLVLAGAAAGFLASLTLPNPAEAWWRGGFFVGIPGPVVVGPPVVYAPPPVYYPPPPVYYPPAPGYPAPLYPPTGYAPPYPPGGYAPQAYAATPGQTCYAGTYVCALGETYTPGSACSCPTGRGPAYGQAR